jgi:hypothetical protein
MSVLGGNKLYALDQTARVHVSMKTNDICDRTLFVGLHASCKNEFDTKQRSRTGATPADMSPSYIYYVLSPT